MVRNEDAGEYQVGCYKLNNLLFSEVKNASEWYVQHLL
jgi:hypothetical protein